MDHELNKASRRLSELPVSCELNGCTIDVQWFRVMQKSGEWKIPRHAHSSFEFHIIARGSCEVTTDTDTFQVEQGSFYLTAPSVFHQQCSSNEEELVEYSLDCKFRNRREASGKEQNEGSELEDFLTKAPCVPYVDTEGVIPLFEHALSEALGVRFGYHIIIQSLVPAIIVAAARSMGFGSAINGTTQKSRMDIIADFVSDNICRDLAPSDIANFMDLSEKQISRIVFASEGFSTKRFITQAKISHAKTLLASDSHSLSEIAEELGFTNISYFTNVFKKNEGITPGAFRSKAHLKHDIHHT